jgi:hypothetical protein
MRPDREFERILDEGLQSLHRGARPEDIAAQFPAEKDRLLPLLETAARVWRTPDPAVSPRAQLASKAQLLQALAEQKETHQVEKKNILDDLGNILLQGRAKRLILILFMLIFAFILFSSLTAASAQSLPGKWLYPFKLAFQEMHILLTFDAQSRRALAAEYTAQRRADLEAAIQENLLPEIEALATLTALPTAKAPTGTPAPDGPP